jgi:tRNA threonylcarbamoyladenosine biosynthesis protein TsaE
MSIEIVTRSERETMAVAAALASHLRGGDMIALTGQLGSGKTCFVRGLAAGLGADPADVSSPTFIICQEYESEAVDALVHVDAYRLSHSRELASIGWDDLLASESIVIAVEWADRIVDALPRQYITIDFEHIDTERRALTLTVPGSFADRVGFSRVADDLSSTLTRSCPTCGAAVSDSADTFPFCSSRCRYADLGRWFSGSYNISRPLTERDDD